MLSAAVFQEQSFTLAATDGRLRSIATYRAGGFPSESLRAAVISKNGALDSCTHVAASLRPSPEEQFLLGWNPAARKVSNRPVSVFLVRRSICDPGVAEIPGGSRSLA